VAPAHVPAVAPPNAMPQPASPLQGSHAPQPPPAPKPMPVPTVGGAPGASGASGAHDLAPPQFDSPTRNRNKARPWWEELFNDDFIRAMEKLTDPQVKQEADFIEDSLGVQKGAMLLDLACGTGRHAIELSKRGYNVVGFDLSLSMLAKAAEEAEERQAQLNFVQGDMREMSFDEMFDGIYCWSTSFGFFEEEKNALVIQRVHRALKKGGQFLLDVINRDYVARQSPSLVWFEGDGAICMDEMQVDWITSRMKIKRTMMIEDGRSKEIEFSMRLYALHELGKLLHESGFRVAEVSGRCATPGVFFGADSPRTIILAEKR
jgi:ubiquinone/menaquinone biosynthesis C-methylase UbiE